MESRPISRPDLIIALRHFGLPSPNIERTLEVIDNYIISQVRYLSLPPRERDPMGRRAQRSVRPTSSEWFECTQCKEYKPKEEFYPKRTHIQQPCAECLSARRRAYMAEYLERKRQLAEKYPELKHIVAPKYSSDVKQQAIAAYQDGMSLRECSRKFGCGSATIGRWLDEAGVQKRPPGRSNRNGTT